MTVNTSAVSVSSVSFLRSRPMRAITLVNLGIHVTVVCCRIAMLSAAAAVDGRLQWCCHAQPSTAALCPLAMRKALALRSFVRCPNACIPRAGISSDAVLSPGCKVLFNFATAEIDTL